MTADFAAVDRGDAHELVAMMDATDAWPVVQAARAWTLEQAEVDGHVVVDVGCGPGTFGRAAAASPVSCAPNASCSGRQIPVLRSPSCDA